VGFFISGVSFATLTVLASCVGDAPATVAAEDATASDATNTPDTAVSDAGSSDAADVQASSSCYGQTFTIIKELDAHSLDGGSWAWVWSPRVFNANTAYFSAGTSLAGLQLYKATFPGVGGALSNPSAVANLSTAAFNWPMSVAPSGSYVVFAQGSTGSRDLQYATGSTDDWSSVQPITTANTSADETDPYLVGSPPKSFYFWRATNDDNSGTVWRVPVNSQDPTFGIPTQVVNCASGICGTPVVSPDESTVFYATWASAAAYLATAETQEAPLDKTFNAGTPIAHPELGIHFPSWVSADGCTLVLANGTPFAANPDAGIQSGLLVATRTPK
jgi:hypothetical protein